MEGEKSVVAARDREGSGASNSGFDGGGGGVYGGGGGGMGMMVHQGHMYGSGGFHQMGVSGGPVMGKSGPNYPGPGSNAGRPR